MRRSVLTIMSCWFLGMGCMGDENEGRPIGAPAIKPPIDDNMPAGFKNTALRLQTSDDSAADGTTLSVAETIAIVRDYFYPQNDFVGPLERLGLIDDRMGELNQRTSERGKKCLDDAPTEYVLAAPLPGGAGFTQLYQCQENTGVPEGEGIESQTLAFGLDGQNLFLNEHRYDLDDSAIVVLAQAALDGSQTEVWDIRYSTPAEQADVLHIIGNDTTGTVEVTTAGSDSTNGGPLACGMHMHSGSEFLYFQGSVAIPEGCTDATSVCVDAVTLEEADMASCVAAGLDVLSLPTLTPEIMAAALPDLNALAQQEISGYTAFDENAE